MNIGEAHARISASGNKELSESANRISITVVCEGESFILNTFPNEYRNLMMLIYDKLSPEDFGDCMGMGKCGTCLIKIEPGVYLSGYDRNEEITLLRSANDRDVRLACQIMIDEHINGITVNVIKP